VGFLRERSIDDALEMEDQETSELAGLWMIRFCLGLGSGRDCAWIQKL
jgi:hypothetical protein